MTSKIKQQLSGILGQGGMEHVMWLDSYVQSLADESLAEINSLEKTQALYKRLWCEAETDLQKFVVLNEKLQDELEEKNKTIDILRNLVLDFSRDLDIETRKRINFECQLADVQSILNNGDNE